MAIYTASYFEPGNHHGQLIAISHTIPKGFKLEKQLKFLVPNPDLLGDWQQGLMTKDEYVQRYRAQITASWREVKQWLDSLRPKLDMTLLCWEKQGEFCHRNLVAKLIQKHRPDVWGGRDVRRVERLLCPHCATPVYPGLEFSFCPTCKTWLKLSQHPALKQ